MQAANGVMCYKALDQWEEALLTNKHMRGPLCSTGDVGAGSNNVSGLPAPVTRDHRSFIYPVRAKQKNYVPPSPPPTLQQPVQKSFKEKLILF